MTQLLHQLIFDQAEQTPDNSALGYKDTNLSYRQLSDKVMQTASALQALGLARHERVAVFLPKLPETVTAFFGATAAGGVFVPVNPILKAEQAKHILTDCNVRVLITNQARLKQLLPLLPECHDLRQVIVIDGDAPALDSIQCLSWEQLQAKAGSYTATDTIDADMAAILYTSGSTGRPKGVVLSHRNMVTGAYSVAEYLENTADDKLLAVLPFSFDYGLSQLTTSFTCGACCQLLEYLLPRDIPKAVDKFGITGLACVPPLWVQLADLDWTEKSQQSLRYITNSGGAMPTATLAKLRDNLPNTAPYLMYGLTEAFRSSYLPPAELDKRPTSMGKAIPNAELMVINEAGEPCQPHEPGELVHRGGLVALGYWNDKERTNERFKPAPDAISGIPTTELAVWSGDTVKMDEDGYLYFIGRTDDMIKTSGYRVSPSEVEETLYSSGLVGEVVALGISHPQLGQAIVIAATAPDNNPSLSETDIVKHCRQALPSFMIPQAIKGHDTLPRNPNGKIDRKALAIQYADLFNTTA